MNLFQTATRFGLAVIAIAIAGCHAASGPGAETRKTIDSMRGNSPLVNAGRMENAADANQRRQGLMYLSSYEFGRKPPYTVRYQEIAATDPDPVVRAAAIRALVVSKDSSATPVFIKLLADIDDQVRLEAVRALSAMPDPAAVEPLLKAAELTPGGGTNGQDLRIAVAEALRHYKQLLVGRTLAGMLGDPAFGVSWEARNSLQYLTGQDLQFDEAAWLTFISGPDKPLG